MSQLSTQPDGILPEEANNTVMSEIKPEQKELVAKLVDGIPKEWIRLPNRDPNFKPFRDLSKDKFDPDVITLGHLPGRTRG